MRALGNYCTLIGKTAHVTAENESEYSIALTQKVFLCSLTATWEISIDISACQ